MMKEMGECGSNQIGGKFVFWDCPMTAGISFNLTASSSD